MRHKLQEAVIIRKKLIQKIADFLQKVLPSNTPLGSVPKIQKPDFTTHPSPLIKPKLTQSGHLLLHYRLRNVKLYMRLQKDH